MPLTTLCRADTPQIANRHGKVHKTMQMFKHPQTWNPFASGFWVQAASFALFPRQGTEISGDGEEVFSNMRKHCWSSSRTGARGKGGPKHPIGRSIWSYFCFSSALPVGSCGYGLKVRYTIDPSLCLSSGFSKCPCPGGEAILSWNWLMVLAPNLAKLQIHANTESLGSKWTGVN